MHRLWTEPRFAGGRTNKAAARSFGESSEDDISRLTLIAVAVVAVVAGTAPAPVRAVTYDKLAYLTFTGSVQVLGVTLGRVTRSGLASSVAAWLVRQLRLRSSCEAWGGRSCWAT
jgi:hypothetical protein